MIELTEDLFVGEGKHRECFRHPNDPSRCIKVLKLSFENDPQPARERKYFAKYRKRGIPFEGVARFHGTVETNRGEGNVFDLVLDSDGQRSRTLKSYVLGGLRVASIQTELETFRHQLLWQRIVVNDFHLNNILLQHREDGTRRLVLIDGVGNTDSIKICDYSKWFQSRKLKRKWADLLRRLAQREREAAETGAGSPEPRIDATAGVSGV